MFRREIEATLLPHCRDHSIGVLAYGPLAHGLLGGRWTPDKTFPPGDWRASSPIFRGEPFRRNLQVVEELKRFAAQRGYTVAQLAIAWVLANPAVHVAIVGARNPQQIEQTAPAAGIKLSQDDLQQLEAILKNAVPIGGPSPEAMPEAT
jgi:aryl-alcohol dehydrogenase-like predicted oxidoreductase